jgi:hypothetical protein
MARYGKQSGTRQMVGLLKLGQQYGRGKLQESVGAALEAGCSDAAAVEHLLHQDELRRNGCDAVETWGSEFLKRKRLLDISASSYSFPTPGRSAPFSGGLPGTAGEICVGTPSRQNAPDRVRAVCRTATETKRGKQARNVRLSGFHTHQRDKPADV